MTSAGMTGAWDLRQETVSFDRLPSIFCSTEQAERDLLPLCLFRNTGSLGKYQGLWNLAQAMKASGVECLPEAGRFLAVEHDVVHAAGYHPTASELKYGSIGDKLNSLTNRVVSSNVAGLDPDLTDWLRSLMSRSRRWVFQLEPIDRYSPWSKLAWRKSGQPRPEYEAPINPVWPYFKAEAPKVEGATLLVAIDNLIPKALPRLVREDVCQDVVLAVLEGEITLEELADCYQDFIKGVFRRFPTKYGPLSLDQPAPWSGPDDLRTLGETLAA